VLFTSIGALLPIFPAMGKSGSLTSLLGNASDNTLDKLGKPGALYADKAIRILLPSGKTFSKLFDVGAKAGLTDGLVRRLNDAAGLAPKEAKPIFRDAINKCQPERCPGYCHKKRWSNAVSANQSRR